MEFIQTTSPMAGSISGTPVFDAVQHHLLFCLISVISLSLRPFYWIFIFENRHKFKGARWGK